MQKILILFDYLYYRLGRLYFKTEGKGTLLPVYIVALSQLLIFMDIYFCIHSLIYGVSSDRNFVHQHFQLIVTFDIITFILLTIGNYRKYKNKYELFLEKWQGESRPLRIVRGIIIFLFLIFITFFTGIVTKLIN